MAKVTSFSIKAYPSYKVIGLAYRVKMMDNIIPQKWDLFFKEGKHKVLEELRAQFPIDEPMDLVGLMVGYDPINETMIYMIGAIMDLKTPDQTGYESVVLTEGLAINAIIEGKAEVYGQAHQLTILSIDEKLYSLPPDFWSMEVYSERFMQAMQKQDGSIVLDYRIPLNLK